MGDRHGAAASASFSRDNSRSARAAYGLRPMPPPPHRIPAGRVADARAARAAADAATPSSAAATARKADERACATLPARRPSPSNMARQCRRRKMRDFSMSGLSLQHGESFATLLSARHECHHGAEKYYMPYQRQRIYIAHDNDCCSRFLRRAQPLQIVLRRHYIAAT